MDFNDTKINPASVTNDASAGTLAWTNPSNGSTSDDAYATAALQAPPAPNTNTQYLKALDFGFDIPTGATINGIEVSREVSKNNNPLVISEAAARIVKGGTIGTTNKSVADNMTTTDTDYVSGSETDLWGETWTAADINATNFGCALRYQSSGAGADTTVQVDSVMITVFYTDNNVSPHQVYAQSASANLEGDKFFQPVI